MTDEKKARHPGQLREAIDRGEGSDKVTYPDPATAPLGTDEEAGGNPSSPQAVDTAFRQEVGKTSEETRRGGGSRGLLVGLWVAFGVVVAAFIVFFISQGA